MKKLALAFFLLNSCLRCPAGAPTTWTIPNNGPPGCTVKVYIYFFWADECGSGWLEGPFDIAGGTAYQRSFNGNGGCTGTTMMAASFRDDMTPKEEQNLKHVPKNACGTFSLPFGPNVSKTMEGAEDAFRFGSAASKSNKMTDLMNKTGTIQDGTTTSLDLLRRTLNVSRDVMSANEDPDQE